MRQFVVCSECGLMSGRKWNVVRHISEQHKGKGEVLGAMQYMLKVQTGLVPAPSYFRPAGFQGTISAVPKKDVSSDSLIKHAAERSLSAVEALIKQTSDHGISNLKISVCAECLTYSYSFHDPKEPSVPKLIHKCDLEWMRNHENMFSNKDSAREVLVQHAPTQLAAIVTTICGDKPELLVFSEQGFRIQAQATLAAAKKLREHSSDLRNTFLAGMAEALSKRKTDLDTVDLSKYSYSWITRAMQKGSTFLEEKELVEYLSFNSSTSFATKISGETYDFVLPVQQPRKSHG